MPFTIVRDDLTRMHVDAIVNTANPMPIIGSGTDSAIYKAAGAEKLLKERIKIGEIQRGQAAITGAYNLPAKYIIHTVGPIWTTGMSGERELLRSCYRNSLELARKRNCKSIAFPLISTGNYGFPKDLALRIVIDTVERFLEENDMMIFLVVFGSDTTRLSEKMFSVIEERIDDAYAAEKEEEEYALNEDLDALEDFRLDAHISMSIRRRRSEMADFDHMSAPMPSIGKVSTSKPDISPKGLSSKKASSPSKRTLETLLNQQDETFSQMLLRLIKEKGMTNTQAYKAANQDKKLFSKIKNDPDYQPKKKTVMAFALGLELNLDETKDLLARAGYAFSPSNNFDKVIQYCIEVQEYSIIEVEIILYDLGLETLCNYSA